MKTDIKYLNRDYDAILKRLIDNIKYYYPNSLNDFSPASPAMIILQLIAYVGDVLNYYVDYQVKQSLLSYATNKQSIYNIAQSYGYKIKTAIPASVQLTFQYLIPSDNSGNPNYNYAPILQSGTIVSSTTSPNAVFTVVNSINFKDISNRTQVLPVYYNNNNMHIIRKKIEGYSVAVKQYTYKCGTNVLNNTSIVLPDINVVKILSVTDSQNNNWYEVDSMANDKIVDPIKQYSSTITQFNTKRTNKRYRKLINSNDKTYLYFGSPLVSNKSQIDLYEHFNNFDSTNLQPTLMILNNNYGEVPHDTTLTIRYYVASSVGVNAMEMDTIVAVNYAPQDELPASEFNVYKSSLLVYNSHPSIGGSGVQSLQQIKQNAYAFSRTQQRLVTPSDYYNLLKILPAEYGTVGKSYIVRNSKTNTIEVYVLSYNNIKYLCETNVAIKQNIGKFFQLYRLLGDRILIKDAKVINFQCRFKVATAKNYNKSEVLYKCIMKVKQFFNIDNYEIGTPIQTDKLRRQLLDVPGTVNVISIQLVSLYDASGLTYSKNYYDMSAANINGEGVYYTAQYPSIFELKYPDKDIIGSAL